MFQSGFGGTFADEPFGLHHRRILRLAGKNQGSRGNSAERRRHEMLDLHAFHLDADFVAEALRELEAGALQEGNELALDLLRREPIGRAGY